MISLDPSIYKLLDPSLLVPLRHIPSSFGHTGTRRGILKSFERVKNYILRAICVHTLKSFHLSLFFLFFLGYEGVEARGPAGHRGVLRRSVMNFKSFDPSESSFEVLFLGDREEAVLEGPTNRRVQSPSKV